MLFCKFIYWELIYGLNSIARKREYACSSLRPFFPVSCEYITKNYCSHSCNSLQTNCCQFYGNHVKGKIRREFYDARKTVFVGKFSQYFQKQLLYYQHNFHLLTKFWISKSLYIISIMSGCADIGGEPFQPRTLDGKKRGLNEVLESGEEYLSAHDGHIR